MRSAATLRAEARVAPTTVDRSIFEFWPDWLFYLPVVAQWVALGLRHGDFSLPTAANPGIETGGLCGESKGAILDQIAQPARELVARYVVVGIDGAFSLGETEAAMRGGGLDYPVVAKPDIGCNGTGVQLLRDSAALARYAGAFPRGQRMMLQEFMPAPNEAGLFYIREPGATRGRISSITLKHPPTVVGDGRRTVRALILAHRRFSRIAAFFLSKPAAWLDRIPPTGEPVQLLFVGNHCKGSIFEDGTAHATPALLAATEEIAAAIPEFHFGRIDVRFVSLAELRAGRGFRILEVNGAGSEATHVWDPRTRLRDAWRSELAHFGAAWRIGAANRARGHRSTGLLRMARMWRLQRRLLASYPPHD